ncbi:MAG: preprotein translocase subunit YajC [Rhodospirillaceae bacterium]
MLISPAFAQAPGGAGSSIQAFIPLILIFVIFYFLLIRPQQKKMREHKAMLEGVRRGDTVVTGGGIIGKVVKVNENDEVIVEIAEDVKVKVRTSTLTTVVNKTEPQKDDKKDANKDDTSGDAGAANDDGGSGGGKKAGGLRGLLGGKKDN